MALNVDVDTEVGGAGERTDFVAREGHATHRLVVKNREFRPIEWDLDCSPDSGSVTYADPAAQTWQQVRVFQHPRSAVQVERRLHHDNDQHIVPHRIDVTLTSYLQDKVVSDARITAVQLVGCGKG